MPPSIDLVFATPTREGIRAEGVVKEMNRHGIRIADFGPQRVRMAVHLGVTDADTRALCFASQASLGTDMHDQQKSKTASQSAGRSNGALSASGLLCQWHGDITEARTSPTSVCTTTSATKRI